jgi:2-iminobutanoate/2-iminopropanoate deaminase
MSDATSPAPALGRTAIHTTDAPAAIGPYNQGIVAGGVLHCSGQLGLVPATGQFIGPGTREQTEQCLRNLEGVCRAAGTDLRRAVMCQVFVVDLAEFPVVNEVYERFFSAPFPARATVQVAALPRGGRVEISAQVLVG